MLSSKPCFIYSPLSSNSLIAAGNTLTNSIADRDIIQSEMIKGNDNVNIQNVGTSDIIGSPLSLNGFIASDNVLTNSVTSQIIRQNDADTGNTNAVIQLVNSIMTEDTLTAGGALQKIEEDAHALGNANTISQDEILTSTANIITSGNIPQNADVFTSI